MSRIPHLIKNASDMGKTTVNPSLSQDGVSFDSTAKDIPPNNVRRFAQEVLNCNVTLLTERFYRRPDEESCDEGQDTVELAPNPQDIRRVVERNIIPEYDHPQIIDAVTEYLYHRIWMM